MSSKSIGNTWEREFSKLLSLWVSNNERDDLFWRDLSSGARATVRINSGKTTAANGDIVATELEYKILTDKYYIDTKSYQSINLNMINPSNLKSNGLYNQWIKTCEDAGKTSKIPLMPCHVRDGVTPKLLFYPIIDKINIQNYIEYNSNGYQFRICLLKDFFEQNKYEDIIK